MLPELWVHRRVLTVRTHRQARIEPSITLCVVLVQQIVQGLVKPLALHQNYSATSGHAGLHCLYIHTHLNLAKATVS